MKVKDNMILRHVMDSDVVVDVTGRFSGLLKLNETSAAIWRAVAAGETQEQIAERLAAEYEVSPEQALADVESFCAAMLDKGFFTR